MEDKNKLSDADFEMVNGGTGENEGKRIVNNFYHKCRECPYFWTDHEFKSKCPKCHSWKNDTKIL